MKNYSKISLLASMLCLFQFSTYSMYVNRGYQDCHDHNISAHKFINSGTIKGTNSVKMKVSSIVGDGTIESPDITISCDKFKFSGSISCDKKCIIYTKKAFDINMFKRSGNGTFKVVISPYDVRCFTQEGLSSAYYDYFCSNSLNLEENAIDNRIKEMRTYAVLNFIDDKVVLEDIKKNLEKHDGFALIISRIEHALTIERVPEEQIITL